MKMRIKAILEAFDGALELVEDEQQRDRFSRVLSASGASVERAVDELIAELTGEINEALGDDIQVDLNYGVDGLSVDVSQSAADDDEPGDETLSFSEGEVEKLTLRLPGELKDRATGAAAEAGYSLNQWIVRVLARELASERSGRRGRGRERRRGRGSELRGWIGH